MAKVLVTGSNGFIGSHIVPLLLSKGYEVHCLVRYTSGIAALRDLPVSIHMGDLRDPATLKIPVENAVYIFHLAAKLLVTNQEDFDETNVTGTKNLLEAAALYAKTTLKRFLYVSSLAACGPNEKAVPYDETAALNPMSWYGLSKKKAEETAHGFFEKIPVTIVRPAIVYGEGEQDLSQIFPLVESRILPKLGIWEKRSVGIYVGDLVEGMVAAAESDNSIGETYFLNHADIVTSKQIVKNIGIAMGKPAGLVIPVPNFLIQAFAPFSELGYHFDSKRPKMTRDKAREVTQSYWLADPAKAKRDFGWIAGTSMVEGMKKTLIPYFEEKRKLRAMALENGFVLWLKYLIIALTLGIVFETFMRALDFYTFNPWWMIIVIIIVAFGLVFGSLAFALRRKTDLVQFVTGVVFAGLIEAVNVLGIFPGYDWVFSEGWPLGITDPWWRTAVLALPGGLFILVLNLIMRNIYKNRLARRGDR
ncbi:MAG: NAD-dependent epimerase/dehydratase family protein [Ferruginibacter sp.]